MKEKKLGLVSVVSTGVGLIVATSCLMSLAQGAGTIGTSFIFSIMIACGLNMLVAASLSELNSLMPNLTGGLAQYTLAGLGPFFTLVSMVGGYLVCNCLMCPVEGGMFSIALKEITGLNIPTWVFSVILTTALIIVNLLGVDMFAKIQNIVAIALIGSFAAIGIIGVFRLGTGEVISQPASMASGPMEIVGMSAAAFWLFIGVEFIIPVSKDVKNPKRNVPLGMFLSLGILCVVQIVLVFGFRNYAFWGELATSDSPHILYGVNLLGQLGLLWMGIITVFAAISTQNSVINSISHICCGMSKMNMLPEFFQKCTKKRNVPYVAILIYGAVIIIIEVTGVSGSDQISMLILIASVFWMVSYIISHLNLIVLRRKMPKAPRSFKVPGGIVLPLIGIAGMVYMIINISNDPHERAFILGMAALIFGLLAIYAVLWIKLRMKIPMFKALPINEIVAMEHPLYYQTHKRLREEEKKKKKSETG